MIYSVNLWGSDPDSGNDDCWTGYDFATLEEAQAVFNAPDPVKAMSLLPEASADFYTYHFRDTTHVELDGSDVHAVRQVRKARKSSRDDSWQREAAFQAGMAFGCDGYNDVMGW